MRSSFYQGRRRSADEIKRDGWREQGVLVVAEDDPRLTWAERELVRQIGTRLYGPGKTNPNGKGDRP